MHTFEGKNGTHFLFNGDYSDITFVNPGSDKEIALNPEDFMDFARMAVSSEMIALLEDKYC